MLDIYDHSDLNPKDGTLRFCSTSAIPDLDDDIFKDFADMKGDDMSSFRSYADGEDLITCGGYKVIDSTYTIVSTSPERPECFHWIKMNAGEEVTLSIGQGTTRHGSRPDSERLSFSLWNPNGELIARGDRRVKFIPRLQFTILSILHTLKEFLHLGALGLELILQLQRQHHTSSPGCMSLMSESNQGKFIRYTGLNSHVKDARRGDEAVDCGWLRNYSQKEEVYLHQAAWFLRIRNNAQP
ncbi:MAG: hypothetical protein H6644_09845 [Caldilineaceae bacterium]|nr:hypothetical protein [Caldilineaceae bacterium]